MFGCDSAAPAGGVHSQVHSGPCRESGAAVHVTGRAQAPWPGKTGLPPTFTEVQPLSGWAQDGMGSGTGKAVQTEGLA